ncbi:intracellular chloride channel [Aureococcus anophagefferens]|nr:intracellular chloride channel [Aureococcus anophagefferens]
MSPADARAFLRARFDVVGVLGAGTATHLFDAFVIAGLALSGEPGAAVRAAQRPRRMRGAAAPRGRSREMRSWGLLANELRPRRTPRRTSAASAFVVGLGEAWRNGSRAALRAALGPAATPPRGCAAARLVDARTSGFRRASRFVVAALADYAAATTGPATFAANCTAAPDCATDYG